MKLSELENAAAALKQLQAYRQELVDLCKVQQFYVRSSSGSGLLSGIYDLELRERMRDQLIRQTQAMVTQLESNLRALGFDVESDE